MKTISILSIILLLIACGKEESNLELFNPEAFAYDLGNSWEVNAIINVRGFDQIENDNNNFVASISFSADMETPDRILLEDVYSDNVEFELGEEIIDIPLEVQFELDSTYSPGKYLINLTVEDTFSGGVVTGVIDFELTE